MKVGSTDFFDPSSRARFSSTAAVLVVLLAADPLLSMRQQQPIIAWMKKAIMDVTEAIHMKTNMRIPISARKFSSSWAVRAIRAPMLMAVPTMEATVMRTASIKAKIARGSDHQRERTATNPTKMRTKVRQTPARKKPNMTCWPMRRMVRIVLTSEGRAMEAPESSWSRRISIGLNHQRASGVEQSVMPLGALSVLYMYFSSSKLDSLIIVALAKVPQADLIKVVQAQAPSNAVEKHSVRDRYGDDIADIKFEKVRLINHGPVVDISDEDEDQEYGCQEVAERGDDGAIAPGFAGHCSECVLGVWGDTVPTVGTLGVDIRGASHLVRIVDVARPSIVKKLIREAGAETQC